MKRVSFGLMALLLTSAVIAQPAMEQQLLNQVQRGEALFRDDIIEDALSRLYRISPQNPEGLLAEIRLAVRLNKVDQAKERLAELQAVAPSSEAYHQGALLLYLTTTQANEKLARARLYSAAGRFEKALEAYDALLQGRYPTADLAQEYWQVWVNQTGDYSRAIDALTQVLQRFPQHPALLRALANFSFSANNPDRALYYLNQLAQRSTERAWAAEREYEYLVDLPISYKSQAAWADFTQRYADLERFAAKSQTALLTQTKLLEDPAWQAGQRGLQLVEQEQSAVQAVQQLRQAVAAYPDDIELVGALGLAHLRLDQREQAIHYFERAIHLDALGDKTSRWVSLLDSTRYWLLLNQASAAAARGDWLEAKRVYDQAHKKDSQNLFAIVGLADAYLALGEPAVAWQYYQKAASMAAADETAQRGVLRYAASLPPQQAMGLLEQMPSVMQDSVLFIQAKRAYQVVLLQEKAEQAQVEQRWEDAITALQQAQELDLNDPWLSYNLATLLRDQGRTKQAMLAFEKHLALHPKTPATRYAHGLLLASLGQWDSALASLGVIDEAAWTEEMKALALRVQENQLMEQAQQLYAAGQTQEAMNLLAAHSESNTVKLQLASWAYETDQHQLALDYYQAVSEEEPLSAMAYRDMAQSWQAIGGEPQQALDWYAQGMVTAELLPTAAISPTRDNVAFTRAMRVEDEDDWLARGLRRDAERLYQQQNPTLTVHNDSWWRRDGTPGVSELSANTTMMQLEYPIKNGKGFLRADHVRMDAGDSVTANGTSAAVGWEGDRLSFDIGTTPQGFMITNLTGGVSYSGSVQQVGWRLTASRRPMSNSLLSFAGSKDPDTGKVWGGVMATGGALSLSWDQGEANGVWADISHHNLKGKNVENNSRIRAMGGYYRRLINKNNELLTVGVNAMHWQYRKDLSDYSFGQGGYYSPKQYNSVSLPMSYSKRTANWSYSVRGGASLSKAKDHQGGSSQGVGYNLSGAVERRLTNHLVLGAGIDLQHSKDYAPSRGMLYLRYTFEPWQGSLPLGLEPLTPHADFK